MIDISNPESKLAFYWESDPNKVNFDDFQSTEKIRTGYFLHQCAKKCDRLGLSKTHFLIHTKSEKLAGFITLSATDLSLSKEHGPRGQKIGKDNYDHFPTIKIDQIAVSKPFQKQGLGTQMVKWIIDMTKEEFAPKLGCRFIYAEILNNEINKQFFSKYRLGFSQIPQEWTKKKILGQRTYYDKRLWTILMYIDLKPKNNPQ